MLEFEGDTPVGGRMYDACCPDPGEAGAMATSLWELAVMSRSYHPHVAQVGQRERGREGGEEVDGWVDEKRGGGRGGGRI
jgi:hypothetical protein